jgi:thiamine-monophosphate kinase
MNDRALLDQIRSITGNATCSDDCATLSLSCGTLVTSTDMLHEKTDFPIGISNWQIGWMSVAVTISDIASMGAQPVQIFLAVGLDDEKRLLEIIRGADACCREYGADYAGGDLDAHEELTIVSTGLGMIYDGAPVYRKGAKPGDLVCVTGLLGRAILGLNGNSEYWRVLCEPKPRVPEGIILRKAGASAMMDISDGLALSLYDIEHESGYGMEISSSKIPLPGDVDRIISLDAALYGGGDFELLFFISSDRIKNITFPYSVIGRVRSDHEILMDGNKLLKKGYLHHW